jgi:hypothetical protein
MVKKSPLEQKLTSKQENRMDSFNASKDAVITGNVTSIRPYEPPSIRVMDEKEVLSSFQVTVASITWWVM